MVVISASIQIVDVEAESKPLVDIHRKIRFETLFSVYFVTCFVIGQIRIWNIAIGKIKLIRPHEEYGCMKIVGSTACRSKKIRDIRGAPMLPK